MRLNIPLALAAAVLAFAAIPALADDATHGKPAVTGNDNAIQRIDAATARHVEILTALLSKVPAQAQAALQKAIAAAQNGHDQAIAALTGHAGSGDDQSAEPATDADSDGVDGGTDAPSGKPGATGLERARGAVAAGFAKSTAVLQGLLDTVPSGAVPRIQAALDRLGSTRSVALRNLDALIAGGRPEHPAAQDRAGRPEIPSRPDRPERPDRPQMPERPERPQVPDHPSPMHG